MFRVYVTRKHPGVKGQVSDRTGHRSNAVENLGPDRIVVSIEGGAHTCQSSENIFLRLGPVARHPRIGDPGLGNPVLVRFGQIRDEAGPAPMVALNWKAFR
jgi:hypothetical protein